MAMVHNGRSVVPVAAMVAALVGTAGCTALSEPAVRPPGAGQPVQSTALEAGAALLQTDAPLDPMNVYVVGFHPIKDDPLHQLTAHHFCNQVNADFLQCALFDGNGRDANLTGIEYIVSARLYDTLPEQERRYWHPHNYEILSGSLVAPAIPGPAEHALMRSLMNSYGKTWHTWSTTGADGAGDRLPLGPPLLAWSANRDGELSGRLVKRRDLTLGTDTEAARRGRADLTALARPQAGVDVLAGKFPWPTHQVAGVRERGEAGRPAAAPPPPFDRLDADGSGVIDRAEASAAAALAGAWARSDLDRDGAIDRSEFAAFEQAQAAADGRAGAEARGRNVGQPPVGGGNP